MQIEIGKIMNRCKVAGKRACKRTFILRPMFGIGRKRGSAAVLMTIAFASMIVLVTCLFAASKSAAGSSYADAALRLAGRSVMSEYDTGLLKSYGLFAFRGDERRIEKDIAFYANASLNKDKSAYAPFAAVGKFTRIFDMSAYDVKANLKEYSLLDLNIFERQLRDAAAAKTVAGLYNGKGGGKNGGKDYSDPLSGHKNRTLRDEGVICSLPSEELVWSFPDLSALNPAQLSGFADAAANDVLISEYIMAVFGQANDGVSSDEKFFDAEAEYIISGKMNDRKNYDSTIFKLRIIRMIANNVAIYMDPKKLAQIEELALPFAAAAGVGEEVARLSITEIWAGAETNNDIKLFEAGKKVAFLKTPSQWALKNGAEVLDGLFTSKMVSPTDSSGADYGTYLRVMLYLMDRETKLLRTMDLIQINMKGTYDKDFLIREYYTGYRFKAWVRGESYEYAEKY